MAFRMRVLLGASLVVCLGVASLGCAVSIPPATTSTDPCATSQRVFAKHTRFEHVEFELAAHRDGLTRYAIPRSQAATSQGEPRLRVRSSDQRVVVDGSLIQPSAHAQQTECGYAPGQLSRQNVPFHWGVTSVSIDDEFTIPEGTAALAYSLRLDVHAEQRGRRQVNLIALRRSDSAQRIFDVGSAMGVRLADGTFVVASRSRSAKTIAYDLPALAVDPSTTQVLRGSLRIAPDGSVAKFHAPCGIRELVGWGSTRLWAIGAGGRRVLGLDVRGDVFFSARTSARATGLMPHRDGVCVVERGEPDQVECFELHGNLAHVIEGPSNASYVTDAAGRVYVASAGSMQAFAPDGSMLWADHRARPSSNVAVSRSMGLCALHVEGQRRELWCYGPST